MEIVIITGMSGAGKSETINIFEDLGYNCIDNMPPSLISKFVDVCKGSSAFERLAIVVDCRAGDLFDTLIEELDKLKCDQVFFKLLFLEAAKEVLIRRYKQSRRMHPLQSVSNGSLTKAIELEKDKMMPARENADFVIDTSLFSAKSLKEQIIKMFGEKERIFSITIMSLGFKYGPQSDVDMLFDVRCLPNPYYITKLKNKTGLDKDVFDYVFKWEQSNEYFEKVLNMLFFLLPLFIDEGKTNLIVAFGCTGGKHRSVSFAQRLGAKLKKNGEKTTIIHRDIDKL